jgi:hypothetical protein
MATCSLQSAVCAGRNLPGWGLGDQAARRALEEIHLAKKTGSLNRYNTVNAVSPEDAELAFVVAAEVDEAAAALAGTG